MLVDRAILTYELDYTDILAGNYDDIKQKTAEFVELRYNEDYDCGVEYYYDYKIMHLQELSDKLKRRIIIELKIYKDIKLAELEKECEERLKGGM